MIKLEPSRPLGAALKFPGLVPKEGGYAFVEGTFDGKALPRPQQPVLVPAGLNAAKEIKKRGRPATAPRTAPSLLYAEFANLDGTREAFLEFANRYGTLQASRSGELLYVDPPLAQEKRLTTKLAVQSLGTWKTQHEKLRLIRETVRLFRSDPAGTSWFTKWQSEQRAVRQEAKDGPDDGQRVPGSRVGDPMPESPEQAYDAVMALLASEIQVGLRVDVSRDASPLLYWVCQDLRAVLYAGLALEITGQIGSLRRCICGSWFEQVHRLQVNCETKCTTRKHREKKRNKASETNG